MKTAVIAFDLLVALLLFSTLVCGVWISQQPVVEASSVRFHMAIGVSTVIAVTLALSVTTFAALQAS